MRSTKFLLASCIVLLFVLSVNGFYFLFSPREEHGGGEPVPLSQAGIPPSGYGFLPLAEATNGSTPVNLLAFGLDEERTRSDVILLFHFVPGEPGLSILSIARDTLVHVDGKAYKINALYSKGGEALLANKVAEITGLPVHYYVTLDFEGFRKVIDVLGGVNFFVPFRMSYDDPTQNLHIHLKKGLQLLDGKKAEQLVRYRKGNYRGQGYIDGDIGRIRMQQDFLKALISQKLNLKYLSKVDDVFALLGKHLKTNITLNDVGRYAGRISALDAETVQAETLPGTSRMIEGVWYFILDQEGTEWMIRNSFNP